MTDKTVQELSEAVRDFVEERSWGKYHNPKDIAISIAIEAGELLELFQWKSETDSSNLVSDPARMANVKDELADVLIYCFSLANKLNVDVSEVMLAKIGKNRSKYPIEKIKGSYKKYTEL